MLPAHLRIGRLLASADRHPTQREEAVFEIVGHFNRAAALLTSEEEREQVAALNLVAGKRAKKAAAFASALNYLSAGSALVAGDGWQRRHDLVFELELHRAECEFLTGEIAVRRAAPRRRSHPVRQPSSSDARWPACWRIHCALQRPDRGLAECLECLRHAGLEIPMHPTESAGASGIRPDLFEARRRRHRRARRAAVADRSHVTRHPRCHRQSHADCDRPWTRTSMSLSSAQPSTSAWSVAIATARASPTSTWGIIAAWHFGDFDAGVRFGRLGYELVERKGLRGSRASSACIFSSLIMPWARHIASCRELVRTTFELANNSGDRHSAVASRGELVSQPVVAGEPLVEAEAEAEVGLEFCRRAAFRDFIDRAAIQAAFVRNLRGLTRQFGSLDDERFDERRMQTHFESQPHLEAASSGIGSRKLQARFLAGNYAAALEASIRAEALLAESIRRNQLLAPSVSGRSEFYGALATRPRVTLGLQRREAAAHRRRGRPSSASSSSGLGTVRRTSRTAPRWWPRNWRGLKGATATRRSSTSKPSVRRATTASSTTKPLPWSSPRTSTRPVASTGSRQAYLRDARSGYRQWGADGKVRQLEAQYPYLSDEHSVVRSDADHAGIG